MSAVGFWLLLALIKNFSVFWMRRPLLQRNVPSFGGGWGRRVSLTIQTRTHNHNTRTFRTFITNVEGVYWSNTSSKWWEVKDWGESVSELMIVKKPNYQELYTVLSCLGDFTVCTFCKILICLCVLLLVLSCLLCNCCWLTVCIAVVVLCVLSYVYFLYCVGIAFFHFRCQTAG